jgi:hypothetical protein
MALESAFSGFFLSSKTAYTLAKTGQKQGKNRVFFVKMQVKTIAFLLSNGML